MGMQLSQMTHVNLYTSFAAQKMFQLQWPSEIWSSGKSATENVLLGAHHGYFEP